jgi:hypothetical protein
MIMTAKIKTIFLITFFVIFSFTETHAQRVFTIDYCHLEEDNPPYSFGDTISLWVHFFVSDTSGADTSAFGDLYFWWQTDSMVAAGVPPRLINITPAYEFIPVGGVLDTVPIDLRPEEWRIITGPVNVYCVWAAMYIPDMEDSIPCCNAYGLTILGDENQVDNTSINLFPNPTTQFMIIQGDQISSIKEMTIISIEGKIAGLKTYEEIKTGRIDLEFLQPGIYFVELKMLDNSIVRKKIQKQ